MGSGEWDECNRMGVTNGRRFENRFSISCNCWSPISGRPFDHKSDFILSSMAKNMDLSQHSIIHPPNLVQICWPIHLTVLTNSLWEHELTRSNEN